MKKWLVFIIYLLIFLWGMANRDIIFSWLQDGSRSYIILFLVLSALFATIPIVPFTLFGGLVGLKYGVTIGLVINWFGAFTAAVIYYLCARYLFGESASKKFSNYKRIKKFHSLIEKYTFISILLFRLVPIIPPFVVHIYSGIRKISVSTYLVATGVGLIPSMFILALGGDQLFKDFSLFLMTLFLYVLFVFTIYIAYRFWIRSKVEYIRE